MYLKYSKIKEGIKNPLNYFQIVFTGKRDTQPKVKKKIFDLQFVKIAQKRTFS
jgi:hypothetical protein